MWGCAAAASRVCQLTGKKANNGYVVTFSHKRNKKLQGVNLQYKRLYWPEAQRFVRLRLSTKVFCLSDAPASQAAQHCCVPCSSPLQGWSVHVLLHVVWVRP